MNTTKLDTTTTPEQQAQVHAWRRPRYDVSESTDAFDVKVSMPGVTRDGVTISVDGESLSITGTRTHEAPKGWRPLRRFSASVFLNSSFSFLGHSLLGSRPRMTKDSSSVS